MKKQTGTIDLKGLNLSSQTANKYITEINDNGIQIHQEGFNPANYDKNMVINSDGIMLNRGNLPMMTLGNNSLDFNIIDTTNNEYTNVARFGAVSTIGVTDNTQSYMQLDFHSLQMKDKEGDPYFYVSDLRDEYGQYLVTNLTFTGDGTTRRFSFSLPSIDTNYTVTVSDSSGGNVTKHTTYIQFSSAPTNGAIITISDYYTTSNKAKAYTFGNRSDNNLGGMSYVIGVNNKASGYISYAEGISTEASGIYSHAEGRRTTASGGSSHAEGYDTTASGDCSHAEGYSIIASGLHSHAEGYGTEASGDDSHAEGRSTYASGDNSHAEGLSTIASGGSSHAEGVSTEAFGGASHAEGYHTSANGSGAHAGGYTSDAVGTSFVHGYHVSAPSTDSFVIGAYNVEDNSGGMASAGEYLFTIGNGTSENNRSNALTVAWDSTVAFGDPSKTFIIEPATISTTSVSANSNAEFTLNVSKTGGYYPVGVVGFSIAAGSLVARRIYIDTQAVDSCQAVANVRNVTSNTAGASTITLNILWIKTT